MLGQGKVDLSITLGKNFSLNNVLYTPGIQRNLLSASFLVKHGFKIIFESDKFNLLKNRMYIDMWYVLGEMFKFNIINKSDSSVYIVDSINLWYARLWYVNFKSIESMIKVCLLLICQNEK